MAFDWDDASDFFDADWTETYIYKTKNYSGIPYSRDNPMSVLPAGLSEGVAQMVMFKRSDFTALPKTDEIIKQGSTDYRIMGVSEDSTQKTFTLVLAQKYG